MSRWHGPGRHTTKGYYWRGVVCPFCGLKYRDFRIAVYFPWLEYVDMWDESKIELRLEREPPGSDEPPDPNRPVNRRSVLGRMFQYKQEGWKRHLRECEEVYMCIYVNNSTGDRLQLVDVEDPVDGPKTYILEDEDGNKHRWAEIHFKRCWKPLLDQ